MNVFIHVQRWYTDRDLRFVGIFSMLGLREYLMTATLPCSVELKFVLLDTGTKPAHQEYDVQKYILENGTAFYAHSTTMFSDVQLLLIDVTTELNKWLMASTPKQLNVGEIPASPDMTYFEDLYYASDEEEHPNGCSGCYCGYE